jgi:tartrate dehydrogenase/decarboxylase/D-malate dehydrogenase
MARRIALIPGDGIGPEVIDAAVEVLDAALARTSEQYDWVRLPWGSEQYLRDGRMMPNDALEQLRAYDAILLGAVGDPRVADHVTLHGLLLPIRRGFDQFLCVRPVRSYAAVPIPLGRVNGSIDLVVVRENTEGEYADVGGRLYTSTDGEVAVQTNVFTHRGCERIIKAAFQLAATRRRHVTSITKSNAQRYGRVLWDEVFTGVAARHPEIGTRSLLVDAAAMELVRAPERFDVLVGSNLFGDILSDLAAAVTGGVGLAPSANVDPTRACPSMFEPVHGSAPDIAGRGIANPIAAILSGAMMLDHLGSAQAARLIRGAVDQILDTPGPRTPDLGGTAGTKDVMRALTELLDAQDA